jgi:hypothetical protein
LFLQDTPQYHILPVMTLTSCYQILGVSDDAPIEEIKRAYRAKAFLLHPDKNNSPTASADFIEITEAYEYIIAERSGRFRKYQSPFTSTQSQKDKDYEEAKRKAREYAQMRYEEFEKTEAFQTVNALNTILDHLLFLIACGLLVSVPIVLTHFYEFTGLILGCLFLLAVGRPVFAYIKSFFQPTQLWIALMSLVETYFFRYIILTATNLYILLRVGLQTMLPVYITVAIIVIPALVGYGFLFRSKEKKERLFIAICLAPMIMNMLFLLNFFGSSHPTIEQYEIWDEISHTKSGSRQSTLIHLEHDIYDEYLGIRIFSDIRQMQNNEHIIYQFEYGLFGVRVLKEYRFTP